MEEKTRTRIPFEELLSDPENYLEKGNNESYWWIEGNPERFVLRYNFVCISLDKEGKFEIFFLSYHEDGIEDEGAVSYAKHFTKGELQLHKELQYLKGTSGTLSNQCLPMESKNLTEL